MMFYKQPKAIAGACSKSVLGQTEPQEGHSCPGQQLQGVSEPAGQGCVWWEEVNELLCLVAKLKREMEG